MKEETIKRIWRFVYSNSYEFEALSRNTLEVRESEDRAWEATRVFWRFYWVTSFY